ncbi:serine/threonine protein kinase [Priestia sp. Y58]|uniref:serine/threonine protein kinase n=1 Tax=Priestia sp. Y58 TaxID=2922804 RepID=UPI002406ABC3|nr:serine/threonine-protein kinase [Priestia sp. Y58]MDG0032732.1 serine/threonine protein kinase [Priestia sp. Y58]
MVIDNYKVIKVLGSGSFGTTYLVEKDNKPYALKLIRENMMAMQSDGVKRIEREIRILKNIKGEGTVDYIDDGIYKDGLESYRYIVMEYVEGISMEKFVRDTGALSVNGASTLILNIFNAVNEIHEAGIIHRDLKPENIILVDEKTFQVKVLDFGISKLIDASSLTITGQGMGTLAYMAPEQLSSAKDIDYRADYYSLGAIFYELLTNEKPLEMSNQLEAMFKIINEKPEPVINKVQNIPLEISIMIETLLLKEPYKRNLTLDNIRSTLNNCIKRKQEKTFNFNYKPNSLELIIVSQNNDSKLINQISKESDLDGVVFNAPQLIFSDKNYQSLRGEDTRLLIDPYTQTLGYSAFTSKETYKKLPYVINTLKKETPKDFRFASEIERRSRAVLDFQLSYSPDVLLAPFHFYNSDNDDWIRVDYNIYKECRAYLSSINSNKPLYYGISLNIDKFEDTDSIDDFVNFISAAHPHGYYLQVAGDFASLNSNHYYAYAYLVKLLSYSNKEIIVSRTNDFSLGLLGIGANTIATSLGQGDSFKEDFLNRQEKGGASSRRYYIENLMGLYNKNILEDVLSTKIGKKLICNCRHCEGSLNSDKITTFNNCIQHHYLVKRNQIESYSVLSNQERIRKFVTSTEEAQDYIKEILKEKKIKNLSHKHLQVWREVILEISKMDFPQSSGI